MVNKGVLITTMTLASMLTSVTTLWITKLDQYIEASDNMLLLILLVFSLSIVFGIGMGTLYIAYLSGDSNPKKMSSPPKPPKGKSNFILGDD